MKKPSFIRLAVAFAIVAIQGSASAEPAALKQPLELHAMTQEGAKFDAAQLKGKVVLVYFWSTTCAVCRSHLPELRANLAGWKDRPFVLVTVNVDPDMAQWQAYERIAAQTHGPSQRPIALWEAKAVSGKLPITVVADTSGVVKYRYEGRIAAESWDSVAELLP